MYAPVAQRLLYCRGRLDTHEAPPVPGWRVIAGQRARGSRRSDRPRILVGLRNLVDASGQAIATSRAFAAYRDGQLTTDAIFEARRPSMERIFGDLAKVGVQRGDLQLAWDFTIASTASLTGRLIAMRDDAFAALGDAAPTFTVDSVIENPN